METATKNDLKQRDFSTLPAHEINRIINAKDSQIKILSEKVNWFEEQIKLLKSKHYAKSSEKQSTFQATLFDESDEDIQEDTDVQAETEKISYTRKQPNRKDKHLDTSKLPREKHTIDLPDSEKMCACGHCLEKFGEDSREELVFKPATLKVIEHIRIKYTCRHCETVKSPKAIALPLAKSKASASLITDVIVKKYCYHLPFYRQSKMLAHLNMNIPDNTLGGWVMRAAEHLEPLNVALWQQLSKVNLLQADETPVKVLQPEKRGYMWLYHCYLPGKRFVLFDFKLSRAAAVVDEHLKGFTGLLQTDGYSGYNTQRARADVVTFGCWDHARRKFTDVVKACGNNKSGKAGKMLEKMAKLYEIEREIKSLSWDERKAIRQKKAKPTLESMKDFLYKINAPPKSLLGIGVTYCKRQWPELTRYLDYGEVQISNCWIENQVRPFAVGKRNWLFVGNEKSASKAALLYSLIQSCQLNQIDPRTYLEYVLRQVHRMRRKEVDPATLLPNTINKTLLENLDIRQV